MARLIDADKLMEDFPIRIHRYDKEHGDLHFVLGIESVMEYINNNMPTIEPVKRGKWVEDICYDEVIICNACGNEAYFSLDAGTYMVFDYCPYCGAKMESDEE